MANVADAALKGRLPRFKFPTIKARDGYVFTSPVGSFRANAFGVHDTHGNAQQWCADWYDPGYYGGPSITDPTGPETGALRVVRGASCFDSALNARSASRDAITPGYRYCYLSFRVALTPAVARAGARAPPDARGDLPTVRVGDPGNAPDASGFGSVAYKFHMGKYDVTNAEYCRFLNAKAAASDPYGLWNEGMSISVWGGIKRSGGDLCIYTVKPGRAHQPVVWVNFYSAARFANWLTNGRGDGDTESGAYEITGSGPDWTVALPSASQRAAWAAGGRKHWLLPSEDEWYKAAYYKGGANAGYWLYATQSDAPPTSEAPRGARNSANIRDSTTGYALTASTHYDPYYNYLTDVGAYPGSLSAYGTLDQCGNVWQWNEAAIGAEGGLRGGSWAGDSTDASSSTRCARHIGRPATGLADGPIGFRIVSLP